MRMMQIAMAFTVISIVTPAQVRFREDFDGKLQPGWQWIDPKSDSTKSLDTRRGFLRITVTGKHDLWPGNDDFNAPRLMREVEGDFTIETKLTSPKRWSGGLLVWKDSKNFIRFERGPHFRNELYLAVAVDDAFSFAARDYVEGDPTWLRLERRGTTFTASYSLDGKQWLPLKRAYTSFKNPPDGAEDARSMLRESDYKFQEARSFVEMSARGPLLVGLSALGAGGAIKSLKQTVTDYDYFELRGR